MSLKEVLKLIRNVCVCVCMCVHESESERKQARYHSLKGDLLNNRWRCYFLPVQFGASEIVDERSFTPLPVLCKALTRVICNSLLVTII